VKFIGEYYKPDRIMVLIGGHFVMSPKYAAYATNQYLKPKFAIPIHYATFPQLKGTPQEYLQALGRLLARSRSDSERVDTGSWALASFSILPARPSVPGWGRARENRCRWP